MNTYDFTVLWKATKEVSLSQYKWKVTIVVNVASKCWLTPQYEGLEKLYEIYEKDGLMILGFPCNQFAGQEPGTNEEILETCKLNYGVTFPIFSKIDVNGTNTDPLYKYLKKQKWGLFGSSIKWNFTKFLIGRNGEVVKRYPPTITPEQMEEDIKKLLTTI